MNIAMARLDDFWLLSSSQVSSAEDVAFLAIVAVILVGTFFAIVAPQQRRDMATTINIRIESTAPSGQQVAEIPEKESVDPQPTPQSVPQDGQEQSHEEPTILRAEESEKRLDLSLPRIPAPFKQFGIIEKSPRPNLRLEKPSRRAGGSESDTSMTTYESYVSVYGDIEVRISDRCTMVFGSDFVLFNSDVQKVARVRCGKSTGKRDLDRLFRDIRGGR